METDEEDWEDRYQLHVMAGSVVEAVSRVGGWMFDRAFDGWDLTVLIAACPRDVRPLHILGARAVDLESALSGAVGCPAALSVSAELYSEIAGVQHAVQDALRREEAEVTVWGGRQPLDLQRGVQPVHHRLSTAARTFKLCALNAAGIAMDAVHAVETLTCVRRNSKVARDYLSEEQPGPPLRAVKAHASSQG